VSDVMYVFEIVFHMSAGDSGFVLCWWCCQVQFFTQRLKIHTSVQMFKVKGFHFFLKKLTLLFSKDI